MKPRKKNTHEITLRKWQSAADHDRIGIIMHCTDFGIFWQARVWEDFRNAFCMFEESSFVTR